jgi:hypothetical protein
LAFLVFRRENADDNQPSVLAAIQRLDAEFQELQPTPGTRMVGPLRQSRKNAHPVVRGSFKFGDPRWDERYDVLLKYYDAELGRHGWARCGSVRPQHVWGQDLGGKDWFYRRGPDVAFVELAGERTDYEKWDFVVGMKWDWEFHDECP